MNDPRPAWSEQFDAARLEPAPRLPIGPAVDREWAVGGATGAGIKVAVIDSGVEHNHPALARATGPAVSGAVLIEVDDDAPDGWRYVERPHSDLYGHGTACAGIIREFAPECELYSVRVLDGELSGRAWMFAAGLAWAIEHRMDVVNLSLSTTNEEYFDVFHSLVDDAVFQGTMVVSSMPNDVVTSIPSEFSSVFSVASIETDDAYELRYHRGGPGEWGARGIDVEVAWSGGGRVITTGNSFATPHVSGMIAALLSKHPGLTVFQVKTILAALSANGGGA